MHIIRHWENTGCGTELWNLWHRLVRPAPAETRTRSNMIIMKPSTLLFNLVKQSDNKAQLTRHLGHNVNRGKVFPTEVLAVIGRKSSIGDFFFFFPCNCRYWFKSIQGWGSRKYLSLKFWLKSNKSSVSFESNHQSRPVWLTTSKNLT